MAGLEEVKGVVLLAGVRADAPLAVAIHVLPAGVDHGAAPGHALVLPAIRPLSAPGVGHTLELEGEDALLTNSGARGGGAGGLEGVGVHRGSSGGGGSCGGCGGGCSGGSCGCG